MKIQKIKIFFLSMIILGGFSFGGKVKADYPAVLNNISASGSLFLPVVRFTGFTFSGNTFSATAENNRTGFRESTGSISISGISTSGTISGGIPGPSSFLTMTASGNTITSLCEFQSRDQFRQGSCGTITVSGATVSGSVGGVEMQLTGSGNILNATCRRQVRDQFTRVSCGSITFTPNSYSCPSGGILSGTTCLTPVNGSCGSSNGASLASPPTTNLCATGSPSASGQWSWSCTGSNGGTTASCSASQPASVSCTRCSNIFSYAQANFNSYNSDCSTVDSPVTYSNVCACGIKSQDYANFTSTCTPPVCEVTENGQTLNSAPTILCSSGIKSVLSGSGSSADPWRWTCTNNNIGSTMNCSAQKTCTPACSFDESQKSNHCSFEGGGPDSCSGTCPLGTKTDGICCPTNSCGTAQNQGSINPPSSNLCGTNSINHTNPTLSVDGSKWTWTCSNSCASTSCSTGKTFDFSYDHWTEVAP